MKYCYECGRITSGEPLYCNFCGRSYDVKLCPRHHVNPRSAEVCSQCGSRELSTPQPKVSVWWKVMSFILRVVARGLLLLLSLALIAGVIRGLLSSPQGQTGLFVLGILLGVLCWIWSELPDWLRNLVRRALKRKERRNGD
jgi:RNA polymerase subunit RPABC4/transcription elongation factor Spt4